MRRDIRGVIAAGAVQLRRVQTLAREGAWAAAQTARATYRNSVQTDRPKVAAAEQRSPTRPAVLSG